MLNFIEGFGGMEVDPTSGEVVWTGVTGTRTTLQRDGLTIDPNAPAYCPIEARRARLSRRRTCTLASAPVEYLTMRQSDAVVGSRVP